MRASPPLSCARADQYVARRAEHRRGTPRSARRGGARPRRNRRPVGVEASANHSDATALRSRVEAEERREEAAGRLGVAVVKRETDSALEEPPPVLLGERRREERVEAREAFRRRGLLPSSETGAGGLPGRTAARGRLRRRGEGSGVPRRRVSTSHESAARWSAARFVGSASGRRAREGASRRADFRRRARHRLPRDRSGRAIAGRASAGARTPLRIAARRAPAPARRERRQAPCLTAASKASRSSSSKRSAARAGASGKNARERDEAGGAASPPRRRATRRARARSKARGSRRARGPGRARSAPRTASRSSGVVGETRGRARARRAKGSSRLLRREREERGTRRRRPERCPRESRSTPAGSERPRGDASRPATSGAAEPSPRGERRTRPQAVRAGLRLARGLGNGRRAPRPRGAPARQARPRGGEPGGSAAQLTEPSASARPSARMRTSSSWKKSVSWRIVAGRALVVDLPAPLDVVLQTLVEIAGGAALFDLLLVVELDLRDEEAREPARVVERALRTVGGRRGAAARDEARDRPGGARRGRAAA